jgi:hypothetical protein
VISGTEGIDEKAFEPFLEKLRDCVALGQMA